MFFCCLNGFDSCFYQLTKYIKESQFGCVTNALKAMFSDLLTYTLSKTEFGENVHDTRHGLSKIVSSVTTAMRRKRDC